MKLMLQKQYWSRVIASAFCGLALIIYLAIPYNNAFAHVCECVADGHSYVNGECNTNTGKRCIAPMVNGSCPSSTWVTQASCQCYGMYCPEGGDQ
jgi:hypothetical protein